MKLQKIHYLASPYTHKDPLVMRQRFQQVTEMSVELLEQGIFVFSPISYNVPWERYSLPTDFAFWRDFDLSFLIRMDSIIVLKLDGYEKSIGVREELNFAIEHDIPAFYASIDDIKTGKLRKELLSKVGV